jgi:cob(I)alamin adenosyltransferase
MKLYTRTGDEGQTSLLGGLRVSKANPWIDACGAVDELNAWLGLARAAGMDHDLDEAFGMIQRDLFTLGARLADPQGRRPADERSVIADGDVTRLEELIDRLDAEPPPLQRFILPGGSGTGATLHVARTVCRRAERRMAGLQPAPDGVLLRYVNRLSDLLFAAARAANHRAGAPELEW